jgi:hypothetical protein
MGYPVISFSYDDVEQRPEVCIALLRMVMCRFHAHSAPISRAVLAEKEIIRLGIGGWRWRWAVGGGSHWYQGKQAINSGS